MSSFLFVSLFVYKCPTFVCTSPYKICLTNHVRPELKIPDKLLRANNLGARLGIEYGFMWASLVLHMDWFVVARTYHEFESLILVCFVYIIRVHVVFLGRSTTLDRAVAIKYGKDWNEKRNLSFVFEFPMDGLNKGAIIQVPPVGIVCDAIHCSNCCHYLMFV